MSLAACHEAQEHSFQLGETVFLNSGSQPLKVIGFSQNGRIWCEWQDAYGRLDEGSFIPEALCRQLSSN